MDFNYSEEAEAFRCEFRQWLDANLPARSPSARNPELMLDDASDWGFHLKWHRTMHAAGWVGISWPREYGGRGATLEQQVVYAEELARSNAPGLVNGIGIGLVGP